MEHLKTRAKYTTALNIETTWTRNSTSKSKYQQLIYLQPQAVQVEKVHLHFNFMIRKSPGDYG